MHRSTRAADTAVAGHDPRGANRGPIAAPPNFPDDDEESTARFESHGRRAKRKVERIAEWKALNATQHLPVQIEGLLNDLIPDLQVLEQLGVNETRGVDLTQPPVQAVGANIARRPWSCSRVQHR